MTKQEINFIKNDEIYLKIVYSSKNSKGIIFIKQYLYFKRKKKFDKLFKDCEVSLSIAEYNEVLMTNVSLLHERFKARDNRYRNEGYRKVYSKDSTGYRWEK